jgi:hypothetical protein
MRIYPAAIVLGLLTSAAYAKDFSPLPEVKEQRVDEQTYRDTVKRIPDQQPNSDPWGTVRNTGAANDKQSKKPPASK